MSRMPKTITILMADDDEDDCMLVRDAFLESRSRNALHCVQDGEALMDYLFHRGDYSDESLAPVPDLILLDLNMPKKDGREALREIKSNPALRGIPVVVLTTSKLDEDICHSYDMGANSYLTKPLTFDELVTMINHLAKYWFDTVTLRFGRKGKRQPPQAGAPGKIPGRSDD